MQRIMKVESMFLHAIKKGRKQVAITLLESEAVTSRDRHRALRYAIAADDSMMAELILDHSRNHMDQRKLDEYFCQAVRRGQEPMIKLLLREGASPTAIHITKKSALAIAIETQNVKLVNDLLERGADITSIDRYGKSIAMWAASCPSPQILQSVLQYGARTDHALSSAVMNNHYENVRLLLIHGVDPNEANDQGITPLMVSILHGNIRIIKLLVQYGADLDKQNINGDTALMYAGRQGRRELFRILVGLGASTRITNDQGENAYDAVLGYKLDLK